MRLWLGVIACVLAGLVGGCSSRIVGDWTVASGVAGTGDVLRIVDDGTGQRETFRPFRGGQFEAVYDIEWSAGARGFDLVLTCSDARFELTGDTYQGCSEVEAFLSTDLDEPQLWNCEYNRSVDRLECQIDGSRRNYYPF